MRVGCWRGRLGAEMKIAVVLVEPEYDVNVGMAARVMKNFGFSDLRIVNPKCGVGFDAVKFSKHAVGLLKKAKRCRTLGAAVKDCDLVVGTTGVLERNKGTIRSAVPLQKFCAKMDEYPGKRVALLFLWTRSFMRLRSFRFSASADSYSWRTSDGIPCRCARRRSWPESNLSTFSSLLSNWSEGGLFTRPVSIVER